MKQAQSSYSKMRRNVFLLLAFCIIALMISTYTHADVLFGKDYYEKLNEYITNAKESIVVAMYFIIVEEKSPVNMLVDDLIKAKKRGIVVKVIIEDAKLGESLAAYNKLKDNDIDVTTDLPGKTLHIKAVIIDGKYVFLGSANWSRAAILDNYESTIFIDSEKDAKELTEYVDKLTAQKEVRFEQKGIPVSADFLLSPDKGRILVKKHTDKQFDFYLLLLKEGAKTGKNTFRIDEKALVEAMGYTLPKEWGSYKYEQTFYHDTLRNFLKRLKKGGFIDFKENIVTLETKDAKESQAIIIPYEYWTYGYDKTLSTRAKYMYLICLYEASRSVQYPYWFHSQADMAKLYGISRDTVTKGLGELERAGIIEVTRDKLRPPDFSARKANVYKLLPLKPLSQE